MNANYDRLHSLENRVARRIGLSPAGIRGRLALLVLLSLPFATPAVADRQSSNHDAADELRYRFDGWQGPAIDVRVFTPALATADTPIVVVIHGWSRDVERYYRDWSSLAEQHGFIAVVPHYPAEDFPGANEFNQGHVFARDSGVMRPAESWTFASIEAVFDDVVARLGGSQTAYTLYGHSAGSQFVHRFLWYQSGSRTSRYLAANAGWYTLPDDAVDYPYGFRNANISKQQLIAALESDVVLMLGREDTQTESPSLRNTPEAKAQGPNRYVRGLTMFERAQAAAEELDVEFGWTLKIVDDAGHVNAQMAEAAAELVE